MELHGIFEVVTLGVDRLVDDSTIRGDTIEHITQKTESFSSRITAGDFSDDVVHVVEADGRDESLDLTFLSQGPHSGGRLVEWLAMPEDIEQDVRVYEDLQSPSK